MLNRIIGPVHMAPVRVPHDCTDGFLGAYWRKPQCYLDPERRSVMSSFAQFDAEPGLGKLGADLASGAWARRNGDLLALDA
jgi:hypothetical protein